MHKHYNTYVHQKIKYISNGKTREGVVKIKKSQYTLNVLDLETKRLKLIFYSNIINKNKKVIKEELVKGDEVILVTSDYGDLENNPIYGGNFGKQSGRIINDIESTKIVTVEWMFNDCRNEYLRQDLLKNSELMVNPFEQVVENKICGIFNL